MDGGVWTEMSARPLALIVDADASGQSPVSAPGPFEPGDSFAGRYVIERRLGTGGMASVWLAYDRTLERPCALKILDADQALTKAARYRFHREARVAARIRSASVVNIFDHGEWRELPYIAMEYLEGEDLASRIAREGRLDLRQTCDMIAQVARGLTHAHTSGVVHRDIKPENIFLMRSDDGELAKVLDFGIATQVMNAADDESQAGLFLGTPMYASPEQVRGLDVDWRTDLWSLAIVAFECMTGRVPFGGNTLEELCGHILNQPVPPLSDYDAELPHALEAWVTRALARDPEQRFQSAKELAEALCDAVGYVRFSIPSLPPRPELFSEPGDLTSSNTIASPAKRSRARWVTPLVAVVLVLAAGGGYQRGRADGASKTAEHSGAITTSADAQPPQSPQVTVASLPESLDEVCKAHAAAPTRDVDSGAPRRSRPAAVAKPTVAAAAAAPSSVETWRRDPGF